ncbi:MAG: cytochrome c-type biogenesis CcmF C-terminal domain-containing protein, partial [Nitrososphaeraceae archaeon]|nr:cytochrome c-type biogenesis CcmF C-terminal domain-containing protein [Nitrososphaeraceae archaeon]
KTSDTKEVIKKSTYSAGGAILFTALFIIIGGANDLLIILLALTTSFALFVNIDIAIKIIRGNKKMIGAYVSHIGIALFILGVIGSAVYSKEVNLDLVKDKPVSAFGYDITFTSIYPIENNTKYAFNVDVEKGDKKYNVTPVMYISDFNNSLMREPAILTLLTKDIYFSPLGYDEGNNKSNSHSHGAITLQKGSVTDFHNVKITFEKFDISAETMQAMQEGKNFKMGAMLKLEKDGKSEEVELFRKVTDGKVEFTSYKSEFYNVKIDLLNLSAQSIQINLAELNESDTEVQEMVTEPNEVLTVTASVKPFISLVWIGVLVMVIGFFVSVARRLTESMIISE